MQNIVGETKKKIIKTKKYTSLNDLKTIDEISLEVIDAIKNVKAENKISKMERF